MASHNLPSDVFQAYSPNQPITSSLFAEAIKDLPVDTLYAKAAELQNSISHLLSSNIQMKPFADEGDEVCKEAIAENDNVVSRNEERIALCKAEAERRGLRWSEHAAGDQSEGINGHAEGLTDGGVSTEGNAAPASNGRLTDEELRRQLEAQIGGDEDDEDGDGVHL